MTNFNSPRRRRQQGLTLVELLVGLALAGLVTSALLSLNISTSQTSSLLNSRNDLLAETQLAQNYVAAKLREAAYVFPTGTALTLSATNSFSTQKPGAASSTWTVGTDPIVAVILPPEESGSCVTGAPQFCYTFYAYYPVQRATVTANATGAAQPGPDARNDASAWVLMEYRRPYTALALGTVLGTAQATGLSGASGQIVMDYLRPPATGESPLFSQVNGQQQGVSRLTLRLAGARLGSRETRVPQTGRYEVAVYPRNVGKPVSPN